MKLVKPHDKKIILNCYPFEWDMIVGLVYYDKRNPHESFSSMGLFFMPSSLFRNVKKNYTKIIYYSDALCYEI